MAKAKKNLSDSGVDLVHAPDAFPEILFPNAPLHQRGTATWLERVLKGEEPDFFGTGYSLPGLKDLRSIKVMTDRVNATLSVPEQGEIVAPLFTDIAPAFKPEWRSNNPLAKVEVSEGIGKAQDLKEIELLLLCVAREIGRRIVNALTEALKKERLILSGTRASDLFALADDLPADRMGDVRLDMASNRILGTIPGVVILTNAKVRLSSLTEDRSGGQSFRDQDDVLIEKMKVLILSKKAKNVSDAARQVAPEAKKLGTNESVLKRLRNGYGARYPTRRRRA